MTSQRERLRLLAMLCVGLLLPAGVILALQFIPAAAKPLSYVFGPYLLGIFVQLMLLAMVGLGAIGEIPRRVLVLPVAVWLGGLGYWWIEREAVRDRILASGQRIELPVQAEPLVVAGSGFQASTLAQALVAVYNVSQVFAAPYRYRLGEGAMCARTPENLRQVAPWQPGFLARQDKWVIRERVAAPAGGIEVAFKFRPPTIANGILSLNVFGPEVQTTPVEIFQRGKADAVRTKFDVRQERGPLPVVGCWHVMTDVPECGMYLMRAPGMMDANSDRTATGFQYLDNNAYFIARALGLERRRDVSAAVKQSQSH